MVSKLGELGFARKLIKYALYSCKNSKFQRIFFLPKSLLKQKKTKVLFSKNLGVNRRYDIIMMLKQLKIMTYI